MTSLKYHYPLSEMCSLYFQQVIPAMIEDGVRVLIYAGDVDFICNW